VGATLPFEPWNNIPSTIPSSPSETSESQDYVEAIVPVHSTSPDDFDIDYLKFLNFADDPSQEPPTPPSPLQVESSVDTPLEDLQTFLHEQYLPALLLASPVESPSTRTTFSESTSSCESLNDHIWSSASSRTTNPSSPNESDFGSPDDFPKSSHSPSSSLTEFYNSNDSGTTTYDALTEMDKPGTTAALRPSPDVFCSFKFPPVRGAQVNDEPVDGGDGQQGYSDRKGQGSGGNISAAGTSSGGGIAGGSGGHGCARRDDDDDDKKPFNRSTLSTPSDSEASTSEDADVDSADGQDGCAEEPSGANITSSDDDVPLAQRIPTALRAQKTIRLQVRQEREHRRAARALRAAESMSTPQPVSRHLLPGGSIHVTPSSSQAPLESRSLGLARAKTLGAPSRPFSPQGLSKKLKGLVVDPLARHHQSASEHGKLDTPERRPRSANRGLKDPEPAKHLASPAQEVSRSLHRMQSLRQPETGRLDPHRALPIPSGVEQKLARNPSRLRREETLSPRSVPAPRSREDPSPRQPLKRLGEEPRKLVKPYPEARSTRTSGELERHPRPSLQRAPVPAGDALLTSPPFPRPLALPVVQQRVFIGDMQHFNMVEISPSTNAGNLIEMVEAQGSLKKWVGSGNWMVWEVAQDFGMGQHCQCHLSHHFLMNCYLQNDPSGASSFWLTSKHRGTRTR